MRFGNRRPFYGGEDVNALVVAVLGGAAKLFGFFPNPWKWLLETAPQLPKKNFCQG
ncbi:hypothetical protein [Microcystis sp. LE19-8.1F]|uniref:hypothetical protein n=1 Tax=Microcystis sp. LE19-8.1F TaxID=3016437 RepID=UPI002582F260|nr:hypothetical protein [Microcystis sp. LE19-8.1F]